MATKLFVGKLSFSTTSDSLRALFATYGTVTSADVINDRGTGQSKGFGFVEMETQADAQSAIDALDGKEFEGRIIVVNVARPREDRPSYGSGGGHGNGGGRRDFRSGFNRR
jgi:RNA recognition motif-containing protein